MDIALQQFAMVAGAHFLALLSPGPDFFLVLRSTVVDGWRAASAVCLGIAAANGVFIACTLAGFAAVRPGSTLFVALQWAGCAYLAYLGWRFLRSPGSALAPPRPACGPVQSRRARWTSRFAMGFMSGILNPKNALFYASLFALLATAGASARAQLAYGAWMFAAVLGWDLLVAAAMGHPAVAGRFARHVKGIENLTGAVLLGLAGMLAWTAAGAR